MSLPRALRIGTRSSALALWQARHVESLIRAQAGAPPVELVHIRTEGDVRTDVPLWQVGGRAFFTKEIDKALLGGEVDVAVHSLKDLSTVLEPGIELSAMLEREDPRDALISRGSVRLEELPRGARVGTSSLRRRAFVARARPDAVLLELRGNVPTRVKKLAEGEYDAIVLATAGLRRLGLEHHVAQHLSPDSFPPAVSQGVIGVCCREGDPVAERWLRALDHRASRLAATAERALLRKLEGGCQVPLGALGTVIAAAQGSQSSSGISRAQSESSRETLRLHAAVCASDGSSILRALAELPATLANAAAVGVRVAEDLLAQGAAQLMADERLSRRLVEAP